MKDDDKVKKEAEELAVQSGEEVIIEEKSAETSIGEDEQVKAKEA